MDYEYVDANCLKEHPQNPKIHTIQQVEKIKNSIDRFGLRKNLVIDEDNVILVGNGRKRALSGLVPVVRLVGLSEEEKLELLVMDNRLNAATGYEPKTYEAAVEVLRRHSYPLEEVGLMAEVLGETGERAKDENQLSKSMNRYLEGETKRLVLYFTPEERERIEARIDRIMREEEVPMRCDLVVEMLNEYERSYGVLC